jgi:hypothetical protein
MLFESVFSTLIDRKHAAEPERGAVRGVLVFPHWNGGVYVYSRITHLEAQE